MPFDFASLSAEDAAQVRRHTERIGRRDMQRRRAWLGDGYDLFRVREIIAGTRFEAWVKEETPFCVRTAYNLSDAAKMLFDAAGSAKFADLPPIKKTVAYLLAAPATPESVRTRFLPRLIEGTEVTLKDVRAALPPPPVSESDEESEIEAAPMREPSGAVMSFARGLRLHERQLLRSLFQSGQLHMLVEALDWLDADPTTVTAATADRLADHAAEAIRNTPHVEAAAALPTDDEDAADEKPPRLH